MLRERVTRSIDRRGDMYPKTIAEMVEMALKHVPQAEYEKIVATSMDDYCTFAHFGMGLWIRDVLLQGNPNRERLELDFERVGCKIELDDMVDTVVGMTWDFIKEWSET